MLSAPGCREGAAVVPPPGAVPHHHSQNCDPCLFPLEFQAQILSAGVSEGCGALGMGGEGPR